MTEGQLKAWLKENLRIAVSVVYMDDGCPEEGMPSSQKVEVDLLLADGTVIDSDETTIS